MQGTRLSFRTKEDAIHFAEKQGIFFAMSLPYEPRLNYLQDGIILCMSPPPAFIKVLMFHHSQQPTVKRIPPKNYAENYVYRPNTLRIMRTK